MLTRRSLVLSAFAVAACGAPATEAWDTQLVILRHMDRNPGNPVINDIGRARALALAPALADLEVDEIVAPDLERNVLSTEPFAAARGIEPTYIDTSRNVTELLTAKAQGRSVVWIGNSTNLEEIWADLALPGEPPTIYGRIAVLRRVGSGRWFVGDERRFEP